MLKPFSSLLSESWTFVQKHILVLAVGAIIFGLLSGILNWNFGMHSQKMMGVDPQRMQELSDRARNGDGSAQEEMMKTIFGEGAMPTTDEEAAAMIRNRMSMGFFSALPVIGLSVLISIVISVLAGTYFMIVAIHSLDDVGSAFSKTASVVVKVLGLWIWCALRSFIWVPFIGIFLAIYFGPRLALAPIYLLEKSKGITESARLSMKTTDGYWWKIFSNSFLMGLILFVVSIVASGILNALGILPFLLTPIVTMFLTSFAVVFTVNLSHSILAQKA
jgi:hypothetical protein